MDEFQDHMIQIDFGIWKPITKSTINTLRDEGWMEEYNIFFKDVEQLQLELSKEDSLGLQMFDEDTVEKYNRFDIVIKERYKPENIIDLIDYDNGTILIARRKSI